MLVRSLFVLVLLSTPIVFGDSISLGLPNYGGNGCPAGSVGMVLSPDSSQLSVLFDQFTVEANATRRMDRKVCNMSVPIHVPSGYSISIVQMDYRGFSSIPEGASADMDVDTFFTGVKNNGPRHHRGWKSKMKGDFYVPNRLEKNLVVWSPCGKDVSLKIISSISAKTNSKGEQTLAAIDSLDITAGLTYQIQWQSCVEPKPPHNPPGPPRPPFPPPHGPGPHRPPPR